MLRTAERGVYGIPAAASRGCPGSTCGLLTVCTGINLPVNTGIVQTQAASAHAIDYFPTYPALYLR